MTISSVTISGNSYEVYASVAFADEYLAADMARAVPWSDLSADDKARALVSATRLLQRQMWVAGSPPDLDNPPEVVQQATSLLAADIAAKPALSNGGSTSSNVKAVGAGSARVEFFAPVSGTPLPLAAFELLRGLLGVPASESAADSAALDGTAYGSSDGQRSRFDTSDYGFIGDGYGVVDPDERRW